MNKKTKVAQVCDWVIENIEHNIYLPEQKIPSIRALAKRLNYSAFTISQAYEHLVSLGYLKAIRGSGYFVNPLKTESVQAVAAPSFTQNVADTGWLMQHLFHEQEKDKSPGSGLLPSDWLIPAKIIRQAIKKSAKEAHEFIYTYGHIQGYYPLRKLFATQLAHLGITADPSFMITMPGVSAAIQLILRSLTRPNDYIIVDDPSWFWLLGCLHQLNLNILSVPRDQNGPNLEKLEYLFKTYQPKIYITNSILNNPTSYNVSPSIIYKVLHLLHQYNVYLLEDDIYSPLENNPHTLRYITLDQGERVFYISGVSKILGANWRVAFIYLPKSFLDIILRQKMLSNMTSTELTERSVYSIWLHSYYPKHIDEMRLKLVKQHEKMKNALDKIGIEYPKQANKGIFLWLDLKLDTTKMSIEAKKENYVLAPGYLFSQHTDFSHYLRLNVTRTGDEFLHWLAAYKAAH
ncbi:PLP-dependent aminotransferase family protein [Muribacter muris]|uniref:PLP-dependent aminotransferase family protein n=2 Tax=Bacteria TaxID=2 RepID=A0A4Y9K772_9PAST|nr:PLP-dependent aminotransferase family protein [Muribacter muris]MBF0783957.1 PLP-dependent aminotransferase family protein [Muribacter muris]MBF0827494.1 PLP-dependent aminotransferase family protein [Muribacter muris]TFV13352.1 PLP-dependent aminotransferase family protein [Muribacter muris]